MNTKKSMEIIQVNEFDYNANFIEFGNVNYSGQNKQLDGYLVEYSIKAFNKQGACKTFTIGFQSEERKDGLRNYNGYEVELSQDGYDETTKIHDFLNDDEKSEELIDSLSLKAYAKSKEYYEGV